MALEDKIREKLMTALSPIELKVINESHLHAGHSGSPGTGESHFRVEVCAAGFVGKSRLQAHQMINKALDEELAGPIHALSIVTKVPEPKVSE